MPIDRTFARIEGWLELHAPTARRGLNAPATSADIAKTEAWLGVTFPADMRAAYRMHDGQDVDAPWLIEGWEWMSLARIRDEWTVWKNLLDGGSFAAFESEADGDAVRRDWWHPAWIPITYDGAGDHHCVDLAPGPKGQAGQVIEMWHDAGERPVVAASFAAWLARFADRLEAGLVRVDRDSGFLEAMD